jgi:hypothetical protein
MSVPRAHYLFEHAVALAMAELVVELLEPVHIQQHHRVRYPAALGTSGHLRQALLHGAVIPGSGQAVGSGERFQFPVGLGELGIGEGEFLPPGFQLRILPLHQRKVLPYFL